MKETCPKCGSTMINYGVTELDGESMGYHAQCDDCGTKFIEWYNLEYTESIIKE